MNRLMLWAALGSLSVVFSTRLHLLAYNHDCSAAPLSAASERITRRISEEWKDAYNSGNAARVASLYTEDGHYLSAHIRAHGREAIRSYFQRGIDAGGHIDAIRVQEARSDGKLAYAIGTYEATNAGQRVDGRILVVLEKRGGDWLIAAHEVVVRDQP